MSEDQRVNSSFGDPNAQPRSPTPKQTPTPASFPSPVFETPRPPQGSFTESGGQTPRFAEEYSVFNATPGNLRGNQRLFADFISTDFIGPPLGHKRLLSTEDFPLDPTHRGSLASPRPCVRFPPTDPSRRFPSSPAFVFPKGPSAEAELQLSPNLPPPGKASKKPRRGTLTLPSSEATQILSPPPSAHKGGNKLGPKASNMQDDQPYGHGDYEGSQAQEVAAALLGHPSDMFSYPMAAHGSTHGVFWDPSAMTMDVDFGASQTNFFPPSHRHMGSFDWNCDIQLFQDPVPPPPAPTTTSQESSQPIRRERVLAPKPPASAQGIAPGTTALAGSAIPETFSGSAGDSRGPMMLPTDAVDPGLICSRPTTSSMDVEFTHGSTSRSAEPTPSESSARSAGAKSRRAKGAKEPRRGKTADRSLAKPSAKSASRPCLERSLSENQARKNLGRPLPILAPAMKPKPQADDPGAAAGTSGRISPVRSQRRLSSLASIPESMSHPNLGRPRTSVRFTIDAQGRARAETTFVLDETGTMGITRSRSSRDLSGRSSWCSSSDESSSDEEPIIIPSRCHSRNSFRVPSSRRSVDAMSHSSRRSVSEKSTYTSSGTRDGSAGPLNEGEGEGEGESETETLLTEYEKGGGDAASELRRIVQGRQGRPPPMGIVPSQRVLVSASASDSTSGMHSSNVSPVSLADSTYGTDGQTVRCVCKGNEVDGSRGSMLQCESCEMWLHEKCVSIIRRSMPSPFHCGFCGDLRAATARRMQATDLMSMAERESILVPVKNKLLAAFR